MSVTESFRKQHVEFVAIIGRLQPMLEPTRLVAEMRQVRAALLTLFGKFAVHLTVEDEVLYPRCQQHTDPQVRRLAAAFAEEMAGTKVAVEAFARRWNEPRMRSHPGEFCTEAKALFSVLEDRIHREDTELYAVVDRAG